ncbi:hypothetical protein DSL72_007924 [Monilinia vaccinii-corymbosi]|uniref:Uncharacterized protein n=1 Tax=Monilinia vaccinii-corymbosi TaxID=61207 RepID=A0A8A3PJ03_9HELO|nr:hypothetical protein DSL72_007924 [Monilinia vaccinii-corymbosi]
MNDAEPSLILARHEHAYRQSHHNHLQLHQKLHRRQAVIDTEIAEASANTEVLRTIPEVKRVDVNSDGSIFAVQALPARDNSLLNPQSTTTPTDLPMTASSTGITSATSSDAGVQATSTGQVTSSPSSKPYATSTSAPSAGFSTLTPNANSSTLISSTNPASTPVSASISGSISGSISSSTILFSNATTSTSSSRANSTTRSFTGSTYASTITSSFSSSSSFLSSVASSTSFVSSSTPPSLSSSSSSSPSQTGSTNGGAYVGGGVGTGSVPGSSATSTPIAGGSGSSNGTVVSSTPSTYKIVGGVVGGVAGLAALIFLLMFVLRWKKKNGGMVSLASVAPSTIAGGGGVGGNDGSGAAAQPQGFSNQAPRSMTERRSLAKAVPAALANLSKYKRTSQNTVTNTVSSGGSERGFYRVSGKKLPSVLQHGGDGFGGPNQNTMSGSTFYSSEAPAFPNSNTLSGASFYRDSQGFYGGQPSPPLDPPNTDSGVPVMRPSPARTPVTEHGPFAEPPGPILPRPDILGRSHPSQDGSHASRFTEEV